MKKILSILLAVITVFLSLNITALAINDNDGAFIVEKTITSENILQTTKDTSIEAASSSKLKKSDHVHIYKSGKCKICGQKRNTYKNGFPSEFYKKCPEQGTIKDVSSYKYNGKTIKIPTIKVYVPYGYDKTKQYNVIFLVHGKGGNRDNWLKNNHNMVPYGETSIGKMSGKKLFDWLIYTGETAPFIAISVDLPKNADGTYNDYTLKDYIRNYYIPYVVRKYSTYAKSEKEKDVQKAKDHFAFCGLSRGSTTLYNIALNPSQPVAKMFGHKIYLSGTIDVSLMKSAYGKSTDKLYFATGGIHDWECHEAMKKYKGQIPYKMFIEYDSAHTWYTWFRGCAAALQLAMK